MLIVPVQATQAIPVRAVIHNNERSVFLSQLYGDLHQAIDSSDLNGRICAVLALDLGRFRAVIDILGHMDGAALLQEATGRLLATVDDQNQVVPLGGDEFAIVLPNMASMTEADAMADQILDVLGQPYNSTEGPLLIQASIGIAIYPADAADAPSLLLRANEALYWAKRRGRARACRFDPALHEDLVGRRLLERDLRAAVAAGSFTLEWQPFVTAKPCDLVGYEAFLRWDRPGHGPVPPFELMAVAEASDMAASIDAWVMDAACEEAASWSEPLQVAMNISPASLRQNDLTARITRALLKSGLAASRLELDIDSRSFTESIDLVAGQIGQLKQLGVRLALNDFGNGCSMLGRLKDLPFHKMKLNRSLLIGLEVDRKVAAVLRMALQLGKALGVSVCATGVETRAEFEMLVKHGCDEVQGTFVGVPQEIVAKSSERMIALVDEPDQMTTFKGIALAAAIGMSGWLGIGFTGRWIWTLLR